jgi:hypothetical protein
MNSVPISERVVVELYGGGAEKLLDLSLGDLSIGCEKSL